MKSASSDLTVLVFKENSVARTFRVPIQWISKLGLIAGIIAGIAVLGIFVSAKYYMVARQASRAADPTYIRDLEKEVASLQANIKSLESKTASSTLSVNNPTPQTTTLTVAPTTPNTSVPTHAPLIFSALPSEIESPPAGADIPIIIYDPHVNWAGRTLKVQFFIQYTKEDKGNQQGRIAVLARGAETLIAYPPGILNSGESASLIAPDKGEYFSVSHIREVKADFGPMKSNTALKEVEVFLFGNNDKLLVHQILTPGTNGGASANPPLVTPMITDTPVQDPALEKQTQ
jgi:hypothetical protein